MQLDDYRVTLPIQVRFRDTDLLGHINNAVYATYFESGRMEYWAQLNGGHSFENWPFILARSEIDFLAEAHAGQPLTLGIRVARIGRKSFDFEYLLVRDEDDKTIARGRSVQVMFDYRSKETVPVSDETRARLAAFEGREELAAAC
jgi:acyl-CoA thioester hydrolase